MARKYKRREPKKKLPKISKKNRIYNRKRSFAEKFLIVMGIVIVLSMVISLVFNQFAHAGV
jgi:cell division protein FtsL